MPPRLRKKSRVQAASRDESEPTPRIIDLGDDPVSPSSPDIPPRSLLSRRSISSLKDRVAKGVVRGGKIMRGGFANIGEGFSRITDSTGTRRNVSDPLRSSPTGSQVSDDNEHRNESPDQLSPLLDSTPVKRGLKDRLKRPRKSDTPSDSDGSLSGGSQGQAKKSAAASTRPVSEMGVLQPRPEQDPVTVVEPAEQRSGAGQVYNPGVKVPVKEAADQARSTRVSGQTAYPTPPPTEPSTSPPATTHHSPSDVERDASPSPLPQPHTFSSLLASSKTPEGPGATAARRDPLQLPSFPESPQFLIDTDSIWSRFGQALDGAWTEHRQALLQYRQALIEQEQALDAERQALAEQRQALAEQRAMMAAPSQATSPDPAPDPETTADVTSGLAPQPTTDPLEDVRQSFLKMAPRAFEVSGIMQEDSFWGLKVLSEPQQLQLWNAVWASFDFERSQQIEVDLPAAEQPLDMQILFSALGTWVHYSDDDDHSIRQQVSEKALQIIEAEPDRLSTYVELGSERLEQFLTFKRGLQPIPPPANTGTVLKVPFPWLDVKLSHFQHLGWQFLKEENDEGDMIDYNDFQHPLDPRPVRTPGDRNHFRRWQEGGLLMTDVRVPLPVPLFQDTAALGTVLELLYSTEFHPLCLLEKAWLFARRFSREPTDADLRAALLYQVMICLQAQGPPRLWRMLGFDWPMKEGLAGL